MLERAERRVPLPRVICFPRAAHVHHHSWERQLFGHVDRPLELVHGFHPPHALDLAERQRRSALARRSQVAARRRMQRCEREMAVAQGSRQLQNSFPGVVVEVTARAEQLDPLKTRVGHLPEQLPCQPVRDEKVSGKEPLHDRQYPCAEPASRGSAAPSRSPVCGSIPIAFTKPMWSLRFVAWPIARSACSRLSGNSFSIRISSGIH